MADEKESKESKKSKKGFKAYKSAAKFCPKCGSRMGDHSNRYSCGRCGYTEWKEKS